jgi:hypothetical protein
VDGARLDSDYEPYVHHLGTSADRAGLDRLNAREHKGGTRQPGAEESQSMRVDLGPNIAPSQGLKRRMWSLCTFTQTPK